MIVAIGRQAQQSKWEPIDVSLRSVREMLWLKSTFTLALKLAIL